jgi:hypothetical protein
MLTIDETMGAALMIGYEESPCGTAWKGANPDARRPLMRMMLDDPRESRGSWIMFGGIAGEDDVELIRLILRMRFQGTLSHDEINMIRGLCDAVGCMAFRKIPGAGQLHREMLAHAFWNDLPFRFDDPDWVNQSVALRNPPWSTLLTGYVFAGGSDLEEQIRRLARETDDPEMRAWLLKPITAPGMRENAQMAALRAAIPITDEFRRDLRDQWNGDVERPRLRMRSNEELAAVANTREQSRISHDQRRIRDPEDPVLKELLAEAEAAVEELDDLFRTGDEPAIRRRALKDGSHHFREKERLDADRIRAVVRRLDAVAKIDTKPGAVDVTTWKVWSDAANAEITNARVVYRLEGTHALGEEIRKNPVLDAAPGYTVDRDGALKVVMQREEGIWRWNPFGW